MNKLYFRIALAASLLALVVIVLGAYVRLSHAGLGCPDWPGCYGTLIAPSDASAIEAANRAYPERPFESDKAWKEMIHRYFASTLGLLILALAFIAVKRRKEDQQQLALPIILVAAVCFQGALGMWTVTLLLKPAIVTLHLLGGMLILALLFWTMLSDQIKASDTIPVPAHLRYWALLALITVFCQIALGGWTSTNYVALHCPDLPTCQGQWWPANDFAEGFTIWRELGVDYEGGVLSFEAGTAVHLGHRIGAIFTLFVVGGFALFLLNHARQTGSKLGQRWSLILLAALGLQLSLGLLNIILVLPTAIAVAHNGGAAVLLLTLVAINRKLSHQQDTRVRLSSA